MSLQLHKTIHLHRYQLTISDLKVQEDAPAWLALIEALHEASEDYGGRFTEGRALAYWGERLLPSFNEPMRKRLFHRMVEWGFMEREDGEYYVLTDLARRARANKAFWRSEAGLYEVWVWEENKELRQKLGLSLDPLVVLIQPDAQQGSRGQDYSNKKELFNALRNKEGYYLPSTEGTENSPPTKAIIVEAVNPIHFLSEAQAHLVIQDEIPHAIFIGIPLGKNWSESLEFRLPENGTLWEGKYRLSQLILKETFKEAYDFEEDVLLVPFDVGNLSLNAKHRVEKPQFRQIEFENAIEIEVKRLPRSLEDARAWTLALLEQHLGKYLHSDEELHQQAQTVAKPIYERYSQLTLPSRAEIAKSWFQKGEYRKAYYLQAGIDLSL
ncbi:MAG: hypothetical protein NZZ60_00735 [Bacteroidia bacterium]|nr:hypothetical protein [Bacteroidia bacterium]